MNEIDKLVLLAELEGETCGLNHGEDDEDHFAVDYLTIPMASVKDPEDKFDTTIPICQDCLNALYGDEWTLLFCLDCGSSAWVLQAAAKLKYTHLQSGKHYHMLGLKGCPHCSKEFGGLYFLDPPE